MKRQIQRQRASARAKADSSSPSTSRRKRAVQRRVKQIQSRTEGVVGPLSDVNIVEGSDEACREVDAHAFAEGNDIHLSSGVDLDTPDGQFTLAHELAHVKQQREGRTDALDGVGGDEGVRQTLEDEADQIAERVTGRKLK